MSLFADIWGLLGGGSSSSSSASATNSTSVSVNPNFVTVIDTTPLAASQQALNDALNGKVAPAIASIGTAIKEAATVEQNRVDTLKEVATWVSVAGIAFGAIRLARGG